jgi:hypothetical protein
MTHTLFNILPAGRLVRSAMIALLVSGGWASAQEVDPSTSNLVNRYSVGIASVETADGALADVKAERAAIQARFAAEESRCHSEFFANACVDKAKERRRLSLQKVRKVEVDANAFLRRERVEKRDKDLEEKRVQREEKEAERLNEGKAGGADAVDRTPKPPREHVPKGPDVRPGDPDPRVLRHEARLKKLEERERADEQKRADNAASYERKVKEAEERQRQVEERKKKNEQERAARAQKERERAGRPPFN